MDPDNLSVSMAIGLVQQTIRACSIRKASSNHLSHVFIPSMRFTLLLASFLAILPVSLISLAPSLRIDMNRFVHSLYPRSLRLSSFRPLIFPKTALIISLDAASEHIHFSSLSGIGPVTPDECVRFANSMEALQVRTDPVGGPGKLSAENCLASCNAGKFIYGGLGNNTCRACFTCLFDRHSP